MKREGGHARYEKTENDYREAKPDRAKCVGHGTDCNGPTTCDDNGDASAPGRVELIVSAIIGQAISFVSAVKL